MPTGRLLKPPFPALALRSWGVPHIYGENALAMEYGYGWAQAEDHGETIIRL